MNYQGVFATTTIHAMAAQAQKSERGIGVLADMTPDGVVTIDHRGIIIEYDRCAERTFGYRRADALGKPLGELVISTALLVAYRAAVADWLIGSEANLRMELTAVRSNGEEFPMEMTVAQIPRQLPALFICLIRDMSEVHRFEQEIASKMRNLERSNAELQQFAYALSHDLQEPLRMVASYMQLLERKYDKQLDLDAKEYIGFAVDGAKRMARLIQDMLEYAQVDSQGRAFLPTSMVFVLGEALRNLKVALEEARARVIFGDLPEVVADGSQITRVLQNLIGNALKYRDPGRDPVIHITATRLDEKWEFAVIDNGIGIEPRYFERIFGLFSRLHGRDEFEGTGVGLAVVKKIIERHDGLIRVDSVPGEGSIFSFTLPMIE